MGDNGRFVTLEIKEGGIVTFEDNGKVYIIRFGKIQNTPSTFIKYVLYVKVLKYNLISISQLCDKGYKVSFEASLCIVTNHVDNNIIFIGHTQENVYLIDFNDMSSVSHCPIAINAKINEISWLWYRRLGHASIHLLSKKI